VFLWTRSANDLTLILPRKYRLLNFPSATNFKVQSTLDISKLAGLFFTSSNYPKCKLICTSGNLDLQKSVRTQNHGWKKQSKYIFDSDKRLEVCRIRLIRVRIIESRLYFKVIQSCLKYSPNVRQLRVNRRLTRMQVV